MNSLLKCNTVGSDEGEERKLSGELVSHRRICFDWLIVGHQLSDRLQYVFHVDSGRRLGKTTATILILRRFEVHGGAECWVGDADYVQGDGSSATGVEGKNHRLRVFAGLRDDPFFNNVKRTNEMYGVAGAALQQGTPRDAAVAARKTDISLAISTGHIMCYRQTHLALLTEC